MPSDGCSPNVPVRLAWAAEAGQVVVWLEKASTLLEHGSSAIKQATRSATRQASVLSARQCVLNGTLHITIMSTPLHSVVDTVEDIDSCECGMVDSINQLDKAEAPSIPETYLYYLSLICLDSIVDGLVTFVNPVF